MLLAFFVLTFALTWPCFFAASAVDGAARATLLIVGTFAPGIVGLGLTWYSRGTSGLEVLWSALTRVDVAGRWYLFAVFYWLALKLIAAGIHRIALGTWPAFGATPLLLIAVAIITSTPIQAGEEIGWSGYALPRLIERVGTRWAGVVLAMAIALWHLPLFFVPDVGNYGQSFPSFAIRGVALSVAWTWLYLKTGGSVLLIMLLHSAVNQTNGIIPTRFTSPGSPWAIDTSPIALVTLGVAMVVTLYLLIRMPTAAITEVAAVETT